VTAAQKYFFVHCQKTAGTALKRRLQAHFGQAAVYPDKATDGPMADAVLSPPHLRRVLAERGDEIDVVTGHFPLAVVDTLDHDFATFSVVREPVARTLSYLRHHRRMHPDEGDRPLEEIYDDPFRFHGLVHNHMVKMFSLTSDEVAVDGVLHRIEFSADRLETAKQRVREIDVLGTQEHFDEFTARLASTFGWPDLGDGWANRTEAVDVTEEFRERIAHDNALDIAFYHYVRDELLG
jgi:hypothetical protein